MLKLPAAALAAALLWSGGAGAEMVGQMDTYRSVAGDTLRDIAVRHDLGYVELITANPEVDRWAPPAGTEVVLPQANLLPQVAREGLVINLSEMRLYRFGADGELVASYPVGIGRQGRETPLGTTTIIAKKAFPTWYPPASIRAERPELEAAVPPGPDNPLGEHAFYLDWPSYLIHGTNMPPGVGRRASNGCIRLYPEDVAALFADLPVGTKVTVIDQPIKFGWHDGELYVEAHLPQEQADRYTFTNTFTAEPPRGLIGEAAFQAGEAVDRVDFAALKRAVEERRGYPVRITRPLVETAAERGLRAPNGGRT